MTKGSFDMKILLPADCGVVLDLDDTLYPERDYLRSGYQAIVETLPVDVREKALEQMLAWWNSGAPDVLQRAIDTFPFAHGLGELLEIYRYHPPSISLRGGTNELLQAIKMNGVPTGLITDGRARTQRTKLEALGLTGFFDVEIISEELGSEKPELRNFQGLMHQLDAQRYMYIADNTRKDFIGPNQLGWMSICLLDEGGNIHRQQFDGPTASLPSVCIDRLSLDNFCFPVDLSP